MRHGRTNMNDLNLIDGQGDVGFLTPEGREHIREAAEQMAQKYPTLDAIYSSDLRRSRDTAAIVRNVYGVDVPIQFGKIQAGEEELDVGKALREIDMGSREGKRTPNSLLGSIMSKVMIGMDLRFGTKESWVEVHDRVINGLNVIFRHSKGKGTVLVVTHQLPMQIIAHRVSGEPQVTPGPKAIKNGEFWRLHMEDELPVEDWPVPEPQDGLVV
jgi:broad specificity phosphatase PhoE